MRNESKDGRFGCDLGQFVLDALTHTATLYFLHVLFDFLQVWLTLLQLLLDDHLAHL
jgi:hypothetical protein